MAEKDTLLAITIRAVDRATAVIRAIQAKIAAVAGPTLGVFKSVGAAIGSVLSSIGSAIGGVLEKIPLVGALAAGAIGGAVAGLFHLIGKFDDLGDKADRFGVSVDFLAQMQYAAEKAGAPVEALDNGLLTFSVNMGKLSANSGRFKKFLDLVSPALEEQLKKAKSNEQAFYLLAGAMDKLKDPAKRAALAAASGLGPELAPLLAQGQEGVKKLAARFTELAGSQEDAAKKAGDVDDSMHDLHASVQGAEAAIVSGLAPSMKIIVDQLRDWFVEHRGDITEWAAALGEKIPAAFKAVVDWVGNAIEKVSKFFGILSDIYDKLKEIWDANDAHEQAKQTTATVPASQAGSLAPGAEAAAERTADFHQSYMSALGAAIGLGGIAGTDIGRQATSKVLSIGNSSNDALLNNVYVTGDYQRELGKQLREKAAAAMQARPKGADDDETFGASFRNSQTKITVDFTNAPKGMRAKVDTDSGVDVNTNVGYQMGGAQ